jgi:rod shape-determining protein MreC
LKNYFHENGIWVLIAALALTGVLTITSAVLPNLTSPLSNVIGIVSTPVQGTASTAARWLEGMYNYAFRYDQMEEKLAQAEQELADVRAQLRESQDALAENEHLRAALDLVEEKKDLKLMDVTVTEGSSTSWESTMQISKGANAGIEKGDVVITGTGYLVGVVQEVGSNWARMITIIDPNISVSANVYRTGDTVMLESDLDMMEQGKCKLTYLGEDVSFISGDEVLTSGANGTYPSGLVIGYVESLQASPSGLERYAVVKPAAELESLGTLFVVTDFDND